MLLQALPIQSGGQAANGIPLATDSLTLLPDSTASEPDNTPGELALLDDDASATAPDPAPAAQARPDGDATANSALPSAAPQVTPQSAPQATPKNTPRPAAAQPAIDADGSYTTRDDVALYLHTYGHLPEHFITKREAQSLGWQGGGLDDYAYGCCIGGDRFGNYEGLLPERNGRRYYECDIDTLHKRSRGAKRIIYSNDGLIYYTGDHYESFTLLYGEE